MSDYATFLENKRKVISKAAISVKPSEINQQLFPFQRDIVR